MTEEESKEDLSELIYDLLECFMMTWEELMGMMSTAGYDIWSENVTETANYPTSTNGGRHFKPHHISVSTSLLLIYKTSFACPWLRHGGGIHLYQNDMISK